MGEDILEQKKRELAATEKALADAREAKKKREEKESLIKRLAEFDDVTRRYLYVLDQLDVALTKGLKTEEIKKISEDMNTQSSKFYSFSDLSEAYRAARKTVDKKIKSLGKRIGEMKKENGAKLLANIEIPQVLETEEPENLDDTQPVRPDIGSDTIPIKAETKNKTPQEIRELEALIAVLETMDPKEKGTPYNLPKLSPETEKKISYLEEELERQKRALVHIESLEGTTKEGLNKLRKNIELTQQTIDNLKYAGDAPINIKPETPTPALVPETPTPAPAPEVAPAVTTEDKEKETLAELKRTLRETIENAKKELAEIQRELGEINARKLKRKAEEKAKELEEKQKIAEELAMRTETFSNTEIEEAIKPQLLAINYKGIKVSEVKKVNVTGSGSEVILMSEAVVEFKEKKYPVKIGLVVENNEGVLIIKDNTVDAGLILKTVIKTGIALVKDKITEGIKNYFEKQKGKKITKIWIEGGELKVEF